MTKAAHNFTAALRRLLYVNTTSMASHRRIFRSGFKVSIRVFNTHRGWCPLFRQYYPTHIGVLLRLNGVKQ